MREAVSAREQGEDRVMLDVPISELIGKVLSRIDKERDAFKFHCKDGTVYEMFHESD